MRSRLLHPSGNWIQVALFILNICFFLIFFVCEIVSLLVSFSLSLFVFSFVSFFPFLWRPLLLLLFHQKGSSRAIYIFYLSIKVRGERRESNISPTFYVQLLRQYSFAKRIQSQTVSTKKLLKTISCEKSGRKMLEKLTQERQVSNNVEKAASLKE